MERLRFVNTIVNDVLKLQKNVIFMGHSRGTECALKVAVLNKVSLINLT